METKKQEPKGEIIIYKSSEGPEVKVQLVDETIWLTQAQMADLFATGRAAITKHLNSIFKSAELSEKSTSSILEHMGGTGQRYYTKYYSLDAIIAVGYRVNSKRATQFRVWATKALRDYIIKGYALNEKRIRENHDVKLKELEGAVKLLQSAIESNRLKGYEGDLLKIITDYTNTWILLSKYDQGELAIENVTAKILEELKYEEALDAIKRLKTRLVAQKQAGDIFGKEYGEKFRAVLGNISQSFGGKAVYDSVEEKAAHLLYFTIKDHPFVDGNKRIGSLLFLLFLIGNRCFYNKKGERKITDNTLAALALLIAESKPDQKDTMVKLIVNLINRK